MDFGDKVFLKKYMSDFGDHPLLVNLESNPEYTKYVDDLLRELDGNPELGAKINDIKKFKDWKGIFSELEFAGKVKSLNPEFVKKKRHLRTPDLKASLLGKEVFFEVKLLLENDEARHVSAEIGKIKSDLIVEMNYGLIKPEQTDKIIDFVKSKIDAHEIGSFQFENTDIEIRNRTVNNTQKTLFVTPFVAGTIIDFERIKSRVFEIFYEKLTQLRYRKPVFLVIDCQRWQYNEGTFKRIAYGDINRDESVGLKLNCFADIIEKYARNPEPFNGTDLLPTLTYPKKNGLFFLKDAECINGVIATTRGRTNLLLNPFSEQQLDNDTTRQLRDLLESK